jgi:hypothetical protein
VVLGLALAALPAGAVVDSSGSDPDQPAARAVSAAPLVSPTSAGCGGGILWFGYSAPFEISRFQSLGFNITQTTKPADVNPANLLNFSVLVIAFTGPGVLGAAQADIEAYVKSGHGLLIHQPNSIGTTDYTPANFDVTINDVWWCGVPLGGGPFEATIVDGTHPITTGLVDTDLSAAADFVGSIGPGYFLLAQNEGCADPALAAGTSGAGRVAFEDGNGSSGSIDPGSDAYWTNLFTWLGAGRCVLDHFKCYSVRPPSNIEGRTVTLQDEFLTTSSAVLTPVTLCAPVDKNGEGINDPSAHLICYKGFCIPPRAWNVTTSGIRRCRRSTARRR